MQQSAQATHLHAAETKDRMIGTLTAYQSVPGQENDEEAMLNAMKPGHIPNGHKPILYSIGGEARLATAGDFGEDFKNKLKQDPNTKYHYDLCA